MIQHLSRNNIERGFTLVEVMVVAPIVILVIGVFISATVNMTGEVLSSKGGDNLSYSIQDALNRIEQDIKLSEKFLATNDITLQSPQGYNDDTTAFYNATGANGNALILQQYATTKNPALTTKNIVYLNNSPNACNSSKALLAQNTPMSIDVIYFVKNNTLWRRVVMPANYSTGGCDIDTLSSIVPWQLPSCNPSRTDALCKSKDIKLVEGISSISDFNIDYYDNPDSSSKNTGATTGDTATRATALQTASTAVITINGSDSTAGRTQTQSGIIRAVNASKN